LRPESAHEPCPGGCRPFGTEYFYERSTKRILHYQDGEEQPAIELSDYTEVVDSRRHFCDGMLAVNLLNDELTKRTVPDLKGVTCEWVRFQAALPFI